MSQKIVVSKSGYNAITETDPDNLVFSSDYNTLKYYVNGGMTFDVSVNVGGYYTVTQNITHGLGYKPFFEVYAYSVGYNPVGIFNQTANYSSYLGASVDDDKLYFTASGYNSSGALSTFTTFLALYDGQYISILIPGNQCFDLVVQWTDWLNIPHVPGASSPFPFSDAYMIYTNFGSFQAEYFDRIAYTAGSFPVEGDIVVWSSTYNGGSGHTGVATSTADASTFDCFEQNDPTGTSSHVKNYDYSHILGWLRPKNYDGSGGGVSAINFTAIFKYKLFKNSLGL